MSAGIALIGEDFILADGQAGLAVWSALILGVALNFAPDGKATEWGARCFTAVL
jgi:hypothetical protein